MRSEGQPPPDRIGAADTGAPPAVKARSENNEPTAQARAVMD